MRRLVMVPKDDHLKTLLTGPKVYPATMTCRVVFVGLRTVPQWWRSLFIARNCPPWLFSGRSFRNQTGLCEATALVGQWDDGHQTVTRSRSALLLEFVEANGEDEIV